MRYIGLDLGTKTLGISISDITKMIASTYTTIRYDGDTTNLIEHLDKIIQEEKIEKIILGFPKNMNNSVGDRGNASLEFKSLLENKFNIPVIMQDERLSTKEATNYLVQADMSRKKRKKVIDSVAANIILQTYLDKERGN
ncbi:MAG: Holliday junction resolvase RuvX [Bacilli bacterium]|nr:Holliday junction resolvase RuvX [Bacilli bacterium]